MSCSVIHKIVQGDTGIAFADHLKIQDESIDLTDAQVEAVMVTKAGTQLFRSNADVLQEGESQDKTEPNVRYVFSDGDLDTVGTHDFQWVVTLPSGRIITRPPSPHQIQVCESIAE